MYSYAHQVCTYSDILFFVSSLENNFYFDAIVLGGGTL